MALTIDLLKLSSGKRRILQQFIRACESDSFTDNEVDVLCGTYGVALRKKHREEITNAAKNIDINF